MRVGGRTINGVDTEIHASPDGMFSIHIEGKSVGSATTLEGAVTVARNAINREKTKVNVPFITKSGGERGVATGFHSRNRTVMAKIADGKGEQLDYNYRAFKADMPKDKLDRYFEIATMLTNLRAEQRVIEGQYEITLREKVQQAITEAQSKTLGGVTAKAAARRQANPSRRRR
jgi:hypothetical protein